MKPVAGNKYYVWVDEHLVKAGYCVFANSGWSIFKFSNLFWRVRNEAVLKEVEPCALVKWWRSLCH